jgi:hypothetical protein
MMRRPLVKLTVVAVAFLSLVAGAWAFWSTSGSGNASTSAADAAAVTIGDATPANGLFPNGTADVALKLSNPNPFQVSISSLALDMSQGTDGFDVDGAHSSCDVAALSFDPQSNSGDGWKVPAKVGTTPGTLDLDLPDAVSMSGAAANACQGATFTVYLKVGS